MQTSAARKSTLLTSRFAGSTDKRRPFWQGWRAFAAGAVLALLAGSGIAVSTAGAAEAHDADYLPSCTGVYVNAHDYASNGNNTVSVSINDGPATVVPFGSGLQQTFPSGVSATVQFKYDITVEPGNDTKKPDGTWNNPTWHKHWTDVSKPCVAPTITGSASACDKLAGTTGLNATFGQLDTGHTYTVTLAQGGNTLTTQLAYQPVSADGNVYSEQSWGTLPAGLTYTVKITDNTNSDLSNQTDVASVGCPTNSTITMTPSECTTEGSDNSSFTVMAPNLVAQRSYRVDVYKDGVIQPQAVFTAPGGAYTSGAIAASAGSTYYVTITDVSAQIISDPTVPFKFLPCPHTPTIPKFQVASCKSTGGVSDASVTFSVANLVPLRSYNISVVDSASNVVFTASFTASSSSWPLPPAVDQNVKLNPGSYTLSVTDTGPGGFHASQPIAVDPCPLLPVINLTTTECTVPGGTGSVAISLTNFIATRTYDFTVTQNGVQVGSTESFAAPAAVTWAPTLNALSGMTAGLPYVVLVTDTVVPKVMAAANFSLAPCPGNPLLSVQAACNVLGTSSANVSLGQLVAGQNYTVTVMKASNSSVVSSQTVTGASPTAVLKFGGVPNGNSYKVTVANAANTLTGSTTFSISKCDLQTLAFTGANPMGPAIAGIGFLQFGLMLLAVSLVLRRRRTA